MFECTKLRQPMSPSPRKPGPPSARLSHRPQSASVKLSVDGESCKIRRPMSSDLKDIFLGSARSSSCRPPSPFHHASEFRDPSNIETGRFEDLLEDFTNLIRVEGQRVLSVAKLRAKADVSGSFESQIVELEKSLASTEERLKDAVAELESRKESSNRQSRQLRALADLVSHQSTYSLLITLRNQSPLESTKVLLSTWKENAFARKRDRDGSHVYSYLYSTRLRMHVFHSWRLVASAGCRSADLTLQLEEVKQEYTQKESELVKARDEAVADKESMRKELEIEKIRGVTILKKIKSLFQTRFEDLSSEFTGVIANTEEAVGPAHEEGPCKEDEVVAIAPTVGVTGEVRRKKVIKRVAAKLHIVGVSKKLHK